jgi:DNA-directed RNA polymerase subunit RPC12/RpoP
MKINSITKSNIAKKFFKDDVDNALIAKTDSAYCEKCGHRQMLWGGEKNICRHCGTMVFKDDKTRFKYRLNEKIIRERRKDNGN